MTWVGRLFLGQMPSSLWVQQASQGESNVLWILVGFVVLIAIVILINRGMKGGGSKLHAVSSFSKTAFRKASRSAGLSDEETRFLEVYGKTLGMANPEFVFRNQARLDAFFKEVYRHIEKNSDSETEAEEEKALDAVDRGVHGLDPAEGQIGVEGADGVLDCAHGVSRRTYDEHLARLIGLRDRAVEMGSRCGAEAGTHISGDTHHSQKLASV